MADAEPQEPKPEEVDAVVLPQPEAQPEPETVSEPSAQKAVAEAGIPTAKQRRGGGFLATVAGGVVAAALGFGLARYVVPEGWPFAVPTARDEMLAEQAKVIEALSDQVATLQADLAARPTAEDLAQAVAAAGNASDQAEALSALEARLASIEQRPIGEGGVSLADLAAYQQAVDALTAEVEGLKLVAMQPSAEVEAEARAKVEAAEAAAQAVKDAAEAEASKARQQAALAAVQAAFDLGTPWQDALAALAAENVTLPAEMPSDGVPSLAALQEMFPPAARSALNAALREQMGEGLTDRMTTFLRSQTGARSLTPREGTDPDAILSRAEAALAAGDLATALTEVATLPATAQAELAAWVAAAQQRLDAAQSLATLKSTLE